MFLLWKSTLFTRLYTIVNNIILYTEDNTPHEKDLHPSFTVSPTYIPKSIHTFSSFFPKQEGPQYPIYYLLFIFPYISFTEFSGPIKTTITNSLFLFKDKEVGVKGPQTNHGKKPLLKIPDRKYFCEDF